MIQVRTLFVILSLGVGAAQCQTTAGPAPSDAQLSALTSAIVDEIYAYDLAKSYGSVGRSGPKDTREITVFISPATKNDSLWAIYPLMPLGEVYRQFTLSRGLAIPQLTPDSDFPPTQPSYRTVYMDDDDLCKRKQTWVRRTVSVSLVPTKAEVAAARKRHAKRTGFAPE